MNNDPIGMHIGVCVECDKPYAVCEISGSLLCEKCAQNPKYLQTFIDAANKKKLHS